LDPYQLSLLGVVSSEDIVVVSAVKIPIPDWNNLSEGLISVQFNKLRPVTVLELLEI
jgi:hypothetical protein